MYTIKFHPIRAASNTSPRQSGKNTTAKRRNGKRVAAPSRRIKQHEESLRASPQCRGKTPGTPRRELRRKTKMEDKNNGGAGSVPATADTRRTNPFVRYAELFGGEAFFEGDFLKLHQDDGWIRGADKKSIGPTEMF